MRHEGAVADVTDVIGDTCRMTLARWPTLFALLGTIGIAGCGDASPTPPTSRVRTASAATASASESASKSLPISVQTHRLKKAEGNHGPSSSELIPRSCRYSGRSVTAVGRFAGGFAPEIYRRYGDVVELYVFTRPERGYPEGIQVAVLHREVPGSTWVGKHAGRWRATAPVARSLGKPTRCLVAAQPTHDVQDAPSAY